MGAVTALHCEEAAWQRPAVALAPVSGAVGAGSPWGVRAGLSDPHGLSRGCAAASHLTANGSCFWAPLLVTSALPQHPGLSLAF